MIKKITKSLIILTGLFFLFLFSFNLGTRYPNKKIAYDYYNEGMCRGALYTFNYKELPSIFFREESFKHPLATDEDLKKMGEEHNQRFQEKYNPFYKLNNLSNINLKAN